MVDGETGFLVEPGRSDELARALVKLLRDEELARTMGKAGRQRVELFFSWDSIARQTARLYEELVNP